jgi:hypothetical protein
MPSEVPLKLRDAIHRKHPGELAREALLHHDNARPHTAQVAQDFHLFGPLKTTLVANISLITKRLKQRCGSG